jgi:hypothetical protein
MAVACCAPSPVYWTGLVQWRSCWLVFEEEPVSKPWHDISYCDLCFSDLLQFHQMWQNSSTVNMARPLILIFLHINLSWLSSHPFGSCVSDRENLGLRCYYIICCRHISCFVSVAWVGGVRRGGEGYFNNSLRLYRPIPVVACLLGIWVRIPQEACMSVSCKCCVLSDRGLYVGQVTRPEESYRVWCVWVWSWIVDNEGPWSTGGCWAMVKNKAI